MEDYAPGSISQLLSKNSKSKKNKTSKDSVTEMFKDRIPIEKITQIPSSTNKTESEDDQLQGIKKIRQDAKLRKKAMTEANKKTVFVGNVPISVERKDLLKFFKRYGKIKSVRIRSVMREDGKKPKKACAIKKEFHPMSKSVNAYVLFEEEASAVKALKSNGKELQGNHLRVDLASTSKKEPNRKCSIFIGNLPFDAQEEDLRKHFACCGDIVNVRIIRDAETRIGKGFGYIEFMSSDGVSLALQLNGVRFATKKLRIERCIKKEKTTKLKKTDKTNKSNGPHWRGATADKEKKVKLRTKQRKKQKTGSGKKQK